MYLGAKIASFFANIQSGCYLSADIHACDHTLVSSRRISNCHICSNTWLNIADVLYITFLNVLHRYMLVHVPLILPDLTNKLFNNTNPIKSSI